MKKIGKAAAMAGIAGLALALSAPLAAQATTYHSVNYPSMAACLAEQNKPAYNNSFVRVSLACHKGIGNSHWFAYTTR